MSNAEPDGLWMDGGIVAERTNILINRLIDAMNKQDAYQVSTPELNKVIRKVVGVDTGDSLKQYRENVAKYGPFDVRLGNYHLHDEYRGGGGE